MPVRPRDHEALAAAAAAAGLAPAAALATATGTNGQIAFRRYLGPDRTKGAIFVAAPDGSGERQLTTPPANTPEAQSPARPRRDLRDRDRRLGRAARDAAEEFAHGIEGGAEGAGVANSDLHDFGNHSHNVVRHNLVTGSQDGIFVGFAEGSQDNVVADNHSYNNTNGAITLRRAGVSVEPSPPRKCAAVACAAAHWALAAMRATRRACPDGRSGGGGPLGHAQDDQETFDPGRGRCRVSGDRF